MLAEKVGLVLFKSKSARLVLWISTFNKLIRHIFNMQFGRYVLDWPQRNWQEYCWIWNQLKNFHYKSCETYDVSTRTKKQTCNSGFVIDYQFKEPRQVAVWNSFRLAAKLPTFFFSLSIFVFWCLIPQFQWQLNPNCFLHGEAQGLGKHDILVNKGHVLF